MKFELSKIINNRLLIIGICLSLVVTMYYSYLGIKYISNNHENYKEDYNDKSYEAIKKKYQIMSTRYELTKDKGVPGYRDMDEMYEIAGLSKQDIDNLSDEEKEEIYNDFYYYLKLSAKADLCYNSSDYRKTVLKNAERLRKTHDVYLARVNTRLLYLYADNIRYIISDEEVSSRAIERWELAEYSDYINIVLILLVVCLEFLTEHRSNTFNMIYSSYNGRGKTYIHKIMVIVGFSCVMSVLNTLLMNILILMNSRSGEMLRMNIQNTEYFMYSPYMLKMYQMIILTGLFKLIGYVVTAMFFVFVVTMSNKSIIPFIIGVAVGCGGYGVLDKIIIRMKLLEMNGHNISDINTQYNILRMYTPFALIRDAIGYFARYEPNNVMNYPVTTLTISLLINFIYILIFTIGGYMIYIKRFRRRGA